MGIQHRHSIPCNVSAVGHSILICAVVGRWLIRGEVHNCLMHNGKVP